MTNLLLELVEKPLTYYSIFQNNFERIKHYFDTLNKNYSHFYNSNDICTPLDCVKEMVDSLPSSFLEKKELKILDCCCGNGNFHAYLATKTSLNNLYFNEINEKRIFNLYKYFGENIHLTKKDFLTYPENKIYDLVVSNPPYAKFNNNIRTSKNHNLSRIFIEKALKITKKGGYILFIVPNNWMSFADRNHLPKEMSKYQFIHLNIHGAKKWFPKVGSSFTWFLLKKSENTKPFTVHNHYVLKDIQKIQLRSNLNFIPLYLNDLSLSIIDKVIYAQKTKYKIETTSYLHHYTKKKFLKDQKDDLYQYKIIHTPTKTVYSKIPHKYQQGHKVFISLSNQYKTFIDNCGMTQSVAFIRCKNLQEAQEIKKQLDNPIYRFVNNITRYGNFNNIRILQNFSILESIKLTSAEIKFITQFNSSYYGKKEK